MNDYEKAIQKIKDTQCTNCGGGGEINDQGFGDIFFNTWVCARCGGSGFEPDTHKTKTAVRGS